MDCILKKEDFIFNKTSYLSFYECEINGFKLNIDEEDFTEEELVFSGKLLDLYSEDVHSIDEKLGKPIIRRFGNLSVLTYTEHEFDEDHLLDIEIKGLYNEILEISIDG